MAFPSIQPLPEGEILLVGARCHFRNGDPEQNAVVFNQSGVVNRRFVLGDGINSVQTTSDGAIWVSYFDEGIFGNYGWNKPMGASGLVCFDTNGRIIWEFEPPSSVDTMADCYALNVATDAVWACDYTDFPLVSIDSNECVRAWKNSVGGASALATDGRRVALWGGYGDKHSRFVLQEIADDRLRNETELPIGFPDGISAVATQVIGRGKSLHTFVETSWLTFALDTIPDSRLQG